MNRFVILREAFYRADNPQVRGRILDLCAKAHALQLRNNNRQKGY
jgi:hypothetical protein